MNQDSNSQILHEASAASGEQTKSPNQQKLQHFQHYQRVYEIALLVCYFAIDAGINATSVIMEAQRGGGQPGFALWEPFIWEYSSAISTLLLFPLIVILLKVRPLSWQGLKQTLLTYGVCAIVFSMAHVALMVGMRKVVYFINDSYYDFGQLGFELFYELRKDVWSFVFFIIAIHLYRTLIAQWQGQANPIQEGEQAQNEKSSADDIERLLVKKLGKEFIINVNDVQWLESSGNYVNLYIDDRIYPLRSTLSKLTEQLASKGFCRIHRSYAVRLDAISSITPLPSGDSEVTLQSGKVLNLSRRYKDAFKERLSL